MNEITQKTGAIWARVSTTAQKETSIPTQIELSRQKAKALGYIVPDKFILSTDRTSMQLNDDYKFLELYDLIVKHKIAAIFLLDRDRLHAEPLERLTFISVCKENGVQIIPAQGPEMLDSDEGQLIEMVLAIGKKKSVLRAQMGSKQGLHDRAALHGLPVTFRNPYGYQWNKKALTLEPDSNWDNVKLIFDWLLTGKGYGEIINNLKERGITSPAGQLVWNKTGISNLIHNPLYAGRYASLKKEAVLPKKRKGDTYGKSSLLIKPASEWTYLENVKIITPPITMEQRLKILDQITSHMRLSKRHAKHDYLLRGFVYCREHYGINGRPRAYHGHPKRDTYYYCCPVPGCKNRYIPGPELESYVNMKIGAMLHYGDGRGNLVADNSLFEKIIAKGEAVENTQKAINDELGVLQDKESKIIGKQSRLEDDRYSERISKEIYQNLQPRYEFELKGIQLRRGELSSQLNQLSRQSEAVHSIRELQMASSYLFIMGLESKEKYREVFEALHLMIMPATPEQREAAIRKKHKRPEDVKTFLESKVFMPQYDVQLGTYIPIAIGSARAGGDLPNNQTYPILLTPEYLGTLTPV